MGNLSIKPTDSLNEVDIEVNLMLFEFREDHLYFVYSPELDMHGYGETLGEAHSMLDDLLNNYFEYQGREGTLNDDLIKHGWSVSNKLAAPPPFNSIVERDSSYFERILSKKPTISSGRVNIPLYA